MPQVSDVTRLIPFIAPLLVLVACENRDQPQAEFVVSDSAGVRIVENGVRTAELTATCPVTPDPRLDIGTASGNSEHELYRAFDGVRFADGRIAVVNQGSRQVRVFGADGEFLYLFGAEGDGPGEFQGPYRIWRMAGDSLVVFDSRNQRFSWFDSNGEFSHASVLQPIYMNAPDVVSVSPSIIVADHFFEPAEQGFKDQTLFVVRHDLDGLTGDTIGTYPFGSFGQLGPPELRFGGGPVFEAKTAVASAGDSVFVGRGEEWEVEIRSATGALRGLLRWVGEDREVTSAHLKERERETRERFADSPIPDIVDVILDESIPVADRFPSLSDLYVDRVGSLWVETYRRPGSEGPDRWLVFNSEGRFVCHGSIPGDMRLFEIGTDYILGMERDEMDVEHVRLYGLSRPASE